MDQKQLSSLKSLWVGSLRGTFRDCAGWPWSPTVQFDSGRNWSAEIAAELKTSRSPIIHLRELRAEL